MTDLPGLLKAREIVNASLGKTYSALLRDLDAAIAAERQSGRQIIRCDHCDNGIQSDWGYCAYCGDVLLAADEKAPVQEPSLGRTMGDARAALELTDRDLADPSTRNARLDELAAERQSVEGREEEFHLWFKEHSKPIDRTYAKDFDGEYVDIFVRCAWDAWRAAIRARPSGTFAEGVEASAAVVVEVTRKWANPNGTQYEQGAQDHANRIHRAIRALTPPPPPEVRGDEISATAIDHAYPEVTHNH